MSLSIIESKLSENDRTNPTVQLLLEIIRQQAEEIKKFKDEINRRRKWGRTLNFEFEQRRRSG